MTAGVHIMGPGGLVGEVAIVVACPVCVDGVHRVGDVVIVPLVDPIYASSRSSSCSRAGGTRADPVAVLIGLDTGVEAVRLAHLLVVLAAHLACLGHAAVGVRCHLLRLRGARVGLSAQPGGLGGLLLRLGLGLACLCVGAGGGGLPGQGLALALGGLFPDLLCSLLLGLRAVGAHHEEHDDGDEDHRGDDRPDDPCVVVHGRAS